MSLSRSIARTGRSVSLHTAETTDGSTDRPPAAPVDDEQAVGAALVGSRDVARVEHHDLEKRG